MKSIDDTAAKRYQSGRPLDMINYIMMAACGALIIIGFALMIGGSSTTTEFNADIFSTRRIIVGPTIAFLGYVLMAVAIIFRKPSKSTAQSR